jgi:hypothetical protein
MDSVKAAINHLSERLHVAVQESRDTRDALETKLDHLTMLIRLQVEEKMHEASGFGPRM